MSRASATAKINLALVVGRTREDGKHEVASVLQRVDLADRLSLELAGHTKRERAAEALEQLGFPPATRAERLAPGDFAALAELLS